MNESKSAIHKLPQWAKLLLLAAVIASVPVAFYFDVPAAVWALAGPMFLIHMWTAGQFGHYTRAEHPGLYWIVFGATVLVTVIAFGQLLSLLAGAAQ